MYSCVTNNNTENQYANLHIKNHS